MTGFRLALLAFSGFAIYQIALAVHAHFVGVLLAVAR